VLFGTPSGPHRVNSRTFEDQYNFSSSFQDHRPCDKKIQGLYRHCRTRGNYYYMPKYSV